MDRRVARAARSKAALKKAFLALLRTKEPEDITVAELCRKAGLNRSTFYAHYGYADKLIREVLRDSVEDVFRGPIDQWKLPLENGGVDRAVIADYLERFLGNSTLMRLCTCENSGLYRTIIIQAQIDATMGFPAAPTEYYAAYCYNAGILNLLLEWNNGGKLIPLETVIEIIHEFSKTMYRQWA